MPSDCRMNRIPRLSGFKRYLFLLLSVTLTASVFLFAPIPARNTSQQKQSGNYSYLSGVASQNAHPSPDTVSPEQIAVPLPEIRRMPFQKKIEAESCKYEKPVTVKTEREGFSGKGYAGTLPENTDAALTVSLHIPATQHYMITVCAASDCTVQNTLSANDSTLTQFSLEPGDFTRVTFYGIFLEEGDTTLRIDTLDGGLDVDYIEIADDSSVYNLGFSLDESPCNPDASPEAQKLYGFLCDQWGKQTLTGQYAADSTNRELNLIFEMTGELPAIRFSALGTDDDRMQVEAAIDWNVYMHGVVGLMWHWNAPGSESVYADETDFNLTDALKHKEPEKVAMLTPEQAKHETEIGKLSEEAYLMLLDIDKTSAELEKLRNMRIPVLWRPLYEAGGGWYWWGASGKDAYRKLWSLVYTRMTKYHRLDNLLWLWNGQSTAYLVPDDTFDIATVDVYLQPQMEYGSRYEQFLALAGITKGKKLLGLSECSAFPDPEMMQIDRSMWSFFGRWCGDYLMDPDGNFPNTDESNIDLYNLYNSKLTLSLNDFLSFYQ